MKNYKSTFSLKVNLREWVCIVNFLLLTTVPILANENLVYSQQTTLTVRVANKSVKDVFNHIEKNSEFVFFYQKGAVDLNRQVNLNLENRTVSEILSVLFKDTDIRYEINDRQISLKKVARAEVPVTKQTGNIKINGVITDETGQTVPGANIQVKETKEGAITDIDGKFTINVPSYKVTLLVSFVGYKGQEIKLTNGKNNLQIVLEENVNELDEIVAIGYGRQKKGTLVSSVNTISNKELSIPVRNLSTGLAGKIAGLIAVQRSGEPGYDDASFWIRGVSTFKGGGEPLILVDGVPRKMNDIEPDEIETFSLLKDAAATAVYGAEGANGVILITSKRGREQKPKFNFRAEGSVLSPTRLPKFMGAKDFMDAYNEAHYNEGKLPFYDSELIAKHASHEDLDLYPDVNWMDLLKDQTFNQRYTLSIRGGSARARYFVSGAYYSEKGIFKSNNLTKYNTNIGLDRFNLRSNIDLDVSKTTILNIDLSGQYLMTNYPGVGTSSIFASMTRTAPNQIPMVYSDGTLSGHKMHSGNRNNPYNQLMHSGYAKEWRTGVQSKVSLEQKLDFITNGLLIRGSVSFDANISSSVKRTKNPSLFNASGRDENGKLIFKEIVAGSENLTETQGNSNDKQIYLETSLNYHRVFNNVHDVTGMFLYMQKEKAFSGTALPYRKQSIVGRAAYSYASRYFIEGSFGCTGSENFAEGYRFGIFPAVGVAWLASEEAFYSETLKDIINKLKIRVSYGRTGNDNTGSDRFIYRETLNQGGGGYNIGFTDGGTQGGVGNSIWEGRFPAPYLSWEIEDKKNFGIDLGLFNNQIDLQVDYFDNKRTNILIQRQTISAVTGFQQSPWQNYGIVTNKGMDASIVINKQLGDWKLSARGNFTFARNKMVEFDEVKQKYPWMTATGKRLSTNSWNLMIAEGLYTEDDFIITGEGINRSYQLKNGVAKSGFNSEIRPGDIKYRDMNGDGVTDEYDRVKDVGNPKIPEVVYGFGINAEYKGFYAGIFFQGAGNTSTVFGGNAGQLFHPFSWGVEETSLRKEVANRWSDTNQSQDVLYPRLRTSSFSHNQTLSTWWLRNASFIRLKNVELGYNFTKKMLKPLKMEAMRLYLMGNNLAVWDHIKMWDPEIGNSNEGMNYPLSRTFTLGLEVTF